MPPPNVMVIGATGHAAKYLREIDRLAAQGLVTLRAVTVRNQTGLSPLVEALRNRGVLIYESAEEMLSGNGRVDLCFIPTPPHYHHHHIALATGVGANVLVEKPLAVSIADSLQVQRTAQVSRRKVWVAFQDMYSDSTWMIKDLLLSGRLGRVQSIDILACARRSLEYFSRNDWAGKNRLGDALILDSPVSNACSHFLNLALFWAGSEHNSWSTSLSVEGCLVRAQPIESFDTCSLRFTTNSNVLVTSHLTHSCRRNVSPQILIRCEKGRIEWQHENGFRLISGSSTSFFKIPENKANFSTMIDAAVINCDLTTKHCDIVGSHQHVCLVDAISKNMDIVDAVPASLCRFTTAYGQQVAIAGIEARFKAAFQRGTPLSLREICGC